METKRLWSQWRWLTIALAMVGSAFLLHLWAWHAGNDASYMKLLRCNVLRMPLLGLAWWSVFITFQPAARPEQAPAAKGITLLGLLGWLAFLTGCMGFEILWPAIALLLTLFLVGWVVFARKATSASGKAAVLRSAIAILLFLLTWRLCVSTTPQALDGLGERLAARDAEPKLKAWARELIARQKKQGKFALTRKEIPDFVDELTGRIGLGWPDVRIYTDEPQSCVHIANGSGYAFVIAVYPEGVDPAMPLGGTAGAWMVWMEWRPGIYLATAGK